MSSLEDPRYPLRYQVPAPRVKATVLPSAARLISLASWNGSLVSRPPSSGTEYNSGPLGKAVPRVELKMTFLPSGVQPTAVSWAESNVSRRGLPPYDGLTNTSYCPCRLDEKAIHRPS